MLRVAAVVAGCVLACGAGAAGQIVNGDFSTGSFAPWVVTPTPQGGSYGTMIFGFDIDGPGPLPLSPAAQFIVGRTQAGAGWQGVEMLQPVSLTPGVRYTMRLDWAVHALVNVYNASGGRFELLVDGAVIASETAPTTGVMLSSYGQVSGEFSVAGPGAHLVGVRITRDIPIGEEVFQYVDNVSITGCYANCNGDNAGGVPVLNLADFGCFQTKFALGDPYADCNGDGALNLADFGCFQTRFALGCP